MVCSYHAPLSWNCSDVDNDGISPALELLGILKGAAIQTAPSEMIASAAALGLLAATVAGFQMTRSLTTNLLAPPLIRWMLRRSRPGR